MQEAYIHDLRFGPTVLAVDGHTIEIFRDVSNFRYHRALVTFGSIAGPDRKGCHQLELVQRSTGRGVYSIVVDATGAAQLAPLVAAVQAQG